MQNLRPYQNEAVEALRANLRRGIFRQILVAPTGAGKTTMSSHIIKAAESRGSRTLFLAHRKELIEQCSARLDDEGIDHGIIKAGNRRYYPMMLTQVASVQTLIRRLHKLPPADLIVVDECHRTNGASYQKLLSMYPDAVILGLTATPYRTDGTGLGGTYEAIVQASTPAELTRLGYLVPATVYTTPQTPDFRKVKIKMGEYDVREVERIVDQPKLVGDIYEHWKELAADRKTVIFAHSRRHALLIRESFCDHGERIEYLDGETPEDQRDAILTQLADGSLQIVVNVGILTEGWDCPSVSCVVLARPTKSCGLYLQMAGRALRPAPGKSNCLILDHGGNTHSHGLVTDDRDFSLEGSQKIKGPSDAIHLTTCRECFAIYRGPKCTACGNVNQTTERSALPETESGKLEKVDPEALKNQMQEYFMRWYRVQEENGYRANYAAVMFKKRFGRYPPRGIGPKKAFVREWIDGKPHFRFAGYTHEPG